MSDRLLFDLAMCVGFNGIKIPFLHSWKVAHGDSFGDGLFSDGIRSFIRCELPQIDR